MEIGGALQQARVGRKKQLYDVHGRRLVCAGIVIFAVGPSAVTGVDDGVSETPCRSAAAGFSGPCVLCVSSRNKKKQRDTGRVLMTFPKGGWDCDETGVECAVRETAEESGVGASPIAASKGGVVGEGESIAAFTSHNSSLVSDNNQNGNQGASCQRDALVKKPSPMVAYRNEGRPNATVIFGVPLRALEVCDVFPEAEERERFLVPVHDILMAWVKAAKGSGPTASGGVPLHGEHHELRPEFGVLLQDWMLHHHQRGVGVSSSSSGNRTEDITEETAGDFCDALQRDFVDPSSPVPKFPIVRIDRTEHL